MMKRSALTLAFLLALAACGGRTALKPVEGQGTPPIPRGASAPPTAEQLMQPSTQARPERNADLLSRSQERQDDPFDLPPGATGTTTDTP